jgi:hypothetical protein
LKWSSPKASSTSGWPRRPTMGVRGSSREVSDSSDHAWVHSGVHVAPSSLPRSCWCNRQLCTNHGLGRLSRGGAACASG